MVKTKDDLGNYDIVERWGAFVLFFIVSEKKDQMRGAAILL